MVSPEFRISDEDKREDPYWDLGYSRFPTPESQPPINPDMASTDSINEQDSDDTPVPSGSPPLSSSPNPQPHLFEGDTPDWQLDEDTIAIGKNGIRRARKILSEIPIRDGTLDTEREEGEPTTIPRNDVIAMIEANERLRRPAFPPSSPSYDQDKYLP